MLIFLWNDEDQVKRHIAGIPAVVSKDIAYQNAMKIKINKMQGYKVRELWEELL